MKMREHWGWINVLMRMKKLNWKKFLGLKGLKLKKEFNNYLSFFFFFFYLFEDNMKINYKI